MEESAHVDGVLSRELMERREHEILSPRASFADQSAGRRVPEAEDLFRTVYQRDRDRILHSKSFRRLSHKTQVFLSPEGDHYRTRLTHTLEVSQIARTIARSLRLNEDLTEAIALGHDLGHTPFGHTGEDALSYAIAKREGAPERYDMGYRPFRHNVQSTRVVEFLENGGAGLNLTREVVDGIGCHTGPVRAKTLEGRIVALSDRIAYVNHDIDDAIRAGVIREADLPRGPIALLGSKTSRRIGTLVRDAVASSADLDDITLSPEVGGALAELRNFLFERVYKRSSAKQEEPKAFKLVAYLFDYYSEHFDEVPGEYKHNADDRNVLVADYVAGMTDRYAVRVFEDIAVPKCWAD